MTGRERIAKLIGDLRNEAETLKAKADMFGALADLRLALADELEKTANERTDEQCESAAEIAELPNAPKMGNLN